MSTGTELLKHPAGINGIDRLSHDLVINNHHCIGSDYQIMGLHLLPIGICLFLGNIFSNVGHRHVRRIRLLYIGHI